MTQVSNWRTLQQESIGEKKPTLNVFERLEVRLNTTPEGEITPVMVSTKLENGTFVDTPVPSLKGFYIGSFMIFEAWDNIGKIRYQSSPYFTNENHVYINDKNKSIQGMYSVEEGKNLLIRKNLNPSVKCIVVMATPQGIVTIKTNSYLWIQLFYPFVKAQTHLDYMFELSPVRFKPKEEPFMNIQEKYYEKMDEKNYPACLKVVQQEVITPKLENQLRLDIVYKNFLDYKKHIISQVKISTPAPKAQAPISTNPQASALPFAVVGDGTAQDDDLPF
ncbi:hypothetical protein VB796_08805 [Arcicella sp. LKC2W]|uniref:hypothetical protein n=1 Tax=Arcicella sp. LKC2W TaxID=2984198 RepID=UPI002B1FAEE4|nr:hypothetical protein [Arcicella sp. LKC2W]MEA5459134.1 hypothetical protein [Arcicella sp. LKC2W]